MKVRSAVCYSPTLSFEDVLAHLRLIAPLRQAGINIINGVENWQTHGAFAEHGDMVIIQRDFPRSFDSYQQIVKGARQANIPVVLDLDDLLFFLPENHPDRRSQYFAPSLLPMYQALVEADLVTVTTPRLQNALASYNKHIVVLPNYFDETLWQLRPPVLKSNDEELTIGYMGGSSHRPDIEHITPVLLDIANRYSGKIRFHFWGAQPPAKMLSLPGVTWTRHYHSSYREFSAYFQSQSADIFIAPLNDNLFNRCKSPLKFLEYSAMGSPGVYSHLETYSGVVSHGENGLLASSLDQWNDFLVALIESSEQRFQLASRAQETIRENWLLSQNAYRWNEAFESAAQDIHSLEEREPQEVDIVESINLQLSESFQVEAENHRPKQALKVFISSVDQYATRRLTGAVRRTRRLAGKVVNRIRRAAQTGKEQVIAFRPRPATGPNKISVVVTSYNHERYIAQCLDSILMQKGYFALEIILGDDCSTDGTSKILARYLAQHADVMRLMPGDRNLGVAKNLKRCLEACTGDYIAICEGDDYWTYEYKLQMQMEFLEDHPDDSMCFSAIMLNYEDFNRMMPHPGQQLLTKDFLTTEDLIEQNYIGNFSCCMYRTSVVRELPDRIFDLFAALDWIFNLACSRIGKIGYIRYRMSTYRIHSKGAWSGKEEIEKLREVRRMIDVYNTVLGHEYDAAFAKARATYDDEITHLMKTRSEVNTTTASRGQ